MKMISSSRLRCLLLLLLSITASISYSSAAQRDSKLRLLLHRTPLLGSKQDLTRSSLAELLLSDLFRWRRGSGGGELPLAEEKPEDIHVDLERAAAGGSGPRARPPREEAGCKNFFWKTFTPDEILLTSSHLPRPPRLHQTRYRNCPDRPRSVWMNV
ncbi:LOW QUALITY PROTEIN: somatostatin-1 [Larimichthys crocea]|uniref:LOW QUALITY PROTEIN: somatostatin-1 n=1 Tax=Larimichthys crocea TaxID=215358 RepID=UPI000F602145|nr:LOW QUALITY PROTEIN: somatostatin-1 [Larimichthys crocea]